MLTFTITVDLCYDHTQVKCGTCTLLYVVNNSVTVSMLSSEAITDYLVPVSVWCMVAVVVGRGEATYPDLISAFSKSSP